jgi:hypothetical protein
MGRKREIPKDVWLQIYQSIRNGFIPESITLIPYSGEGIYYAIYEDGEDDNKV